MRIEKIELIGFKSFADKTSFVLHPGITCIVGPNGCGKSNIVDAFRWVLGEQSAKSLRGEKMEEVIFNGSASKKAKGMAEVTMVVSGMNGASQNNGSGQNENVAISRRLYRSGDSEYMVNRNQCRLKDIKDIFLDTGLEVRSYSILEQGRIGEILNSKPQERRFIIEEVAGVMKYKVRKAEALSKLESSRTNLVRINDIIVEIKKQINILDRLAKKAERYKKLSSEVHAIELKIARKEFQQIQDAYTQIIEEHDLLKEKETGLKAEITSIENRTETRRIALLEKEKGLEHVQNTFQAMERDIADIEREIAVAKNDISNLIELQNRLKQQSEEIDTRKDEISLRSGELKENILKISDEMEAHAGALKEKTSVLSEVEEELSGKEDRLENRRREIFRITEELSAIRNEISRQQAAYESVERRELVTARESGDSRKILGEIESSVSSVETEIYSRNNEILLLKEKRDALVRELASGKNSLENLMKELSAAREELASYTSRLDSLKEIVFDRPTRELLSSTDNIKLLASISDVVEVEAEYEKAIESALSEKADSFILEAIEDIEHAVASLRGKDTGRTAFMTNVPSPAFSQERNMPEGVIGRALDFVKVREEFAGVARNLLMHVLIVRDIRTAFDLRNTEGMYTFATIDGEVVEPSGAVVAGEGKGIFRRKREMREMEEAIAGKNTAVEKMQHEIENMKNTILNREADIKGVETAINNLEKEVSLSKLTVENYLDEKERTSRKLAYLTIEHEEILKEKESLRTTLAGSETQTQQIEAKKTEVENETAALQDEILQKKSEIEEQRSGVTDLRLLIASNREKSEALRNELESSSQLIEDLSRKKEDLGTELETFVARISQRETEISGYEERLRKLVSDADLVRMDISGRREEIEKENEELIVVEQGLKLLRHEISGIFSRISDLDVMRAEHKMRLENLSANVRNNYGIGIEDVELAEITTEEEERLVELRKKIQEIGPVNLGTLEEYEELRTRYEFMSKQQEDLNRSIAELEEAISKINSTTRKKLRDAYEALNAKFGEVFVRLFGGGKAELVLTDEHNILETGVDIVAQPPGKKLQNLHLLSGGEKALTALSLQFASFLIKPTPLCILDEADAPLDESNTERFSKMLSELSRDTQFIVVTHNRTSMSVAQHLYGITMEEAGVSKVISMQFTEA